MVFADSHLCRNLIQSQIFTKMQVQVGQSRIDRLAALCFLGEGCMVTAEVTEQRKHRAANLQNAVEGLVFAVGKSLSYRLDLFPRLLTLRRIGRSIARLGLKEWEPRAFILMKRST